MKSGQQDAPTSAQAAYDELAAADASHVLHGMAPVAGTEPLILAQGEGCWVTDARGDKYFDANCGLMNVNVGYGRSELAESAAESMKRLSFAKMFWGHGSVAATRLAEKLSKITPDDISRFFFTASGSEATDSAIKLVRYRNIVGGRPDKLKIIARVQSYHGMSIGAWSATGEQSYWRNFGPRLEGFIHIPQPGRDDSAIEALEATILKEGPDSIAAFIAEPISLPARVNVPPADYWPRVQELCNRFDIALILDEVVTGFGRTGKWFAAEHWKLAPDLMILAKGITSGYFPLGAVAMTSRFVEGLAAGGEAILHGFTAGGHPVGCDVALRNLEIISEEGLVENAALVGDYLRSSLDAAGETTNLLTGVRGLGVLAAVDLVADARQQRAFHSEAGVGAWMVGELTRRHTIMRAYGDTLAIGLPLSATTADVDELVERLSGAVNAIPETSRAAA